MQRVTATQFSAVVLVGGTLMLSLADYFFHWRLSRFGLTVECDMALLSTIGREAQRWCHSCFGLTAEGDAALVITIAREVQHWCHSCFGFTVEGDTAFLSTIGREVLRWLESCFGPATDGDTAIVCEALLYRLAYPFIHAHPLHAAVNGWVLLQLAFRTPLTLRRLLLAFVVAWSCPAFIAVWPTAGTDRFVGTTAMVDPSAMTALTTAPSTVVGLSGVLYTLFGMWMPRVANRLRYNAIVALWLAAGLCTTSVAVGLHLYCYLLGILLSILLSHPHGLPLSHR